MGSRTWRRAPARARPTRCGVAVDAFVAAGHPVLGTSTSNLATRTLEQEAGVRALNTTRLLAALDRGEALAPGTVLLVDEAGMVGTRKYQRLAEHVTAAGGKLIGIGDSRQLAEIEAGGAFRAISERFGAVELPGNRRQVDPEEIRALAALARGRRRRLRPLRRATRPHHRRRRPHRRHARPTGRLVAGHRTPPAAGVGAGRAASQQRRRAQRQRPRTHARRRATRRRRDHRRRPQLRGRRPRRASAQQQDPRRRQRRPRRHRRPSTPTAARSPSSSTPAARSGCRTGTSTPAGSTTATP